VAVLVGVFETQEDAERAFVRLHEVGITEDNLALVANAVHTGPPTSAEELAAQNAADTAAVDAVEAVDGAEPTGTTGDGIPFRLDKDDESLAESSENPGLDAAAFGAAVGVIVGGGMMGPLGAIAGTAVGATIGGLLAGRGMGLHEASSYEEAVRSGRFLVAVDTGRQEPTPEMRAILEVAGAQTVAVE
jgi:hypothetical protein